jgi:hypothetical protein
LFAFFFLVLVFFAIILGTLEDNPAFFFDIPNPQHRNQDLMPMPPMQYTSSHAHSPPASPRSPAPPPLPPSHPYTISSKKLSEESLKELKEKMTRRRSSQLTRGSKPDLHAANAEQPTAPANAPPLMPSSLAEAETLRIKKANSTTSVTSASEPLVRATETKTKTKKQRKKERESCEGKKSDEEEPKKKK